MKFLNDIWDAFASSVKGFDSPRQLALGLTLGLIIGLVPKDSLIPYVVLIFALLTNANLLLLIVAGLTSSLISPLLDPISHGLGMWVLTFDPLESFWVWCCQLPVVPWTRLENTVVMGSLTLGLLVAIPIYIIGFQFFQRFGEPFFNLIFQNRLARWFIGSPAHAPNLQES